MSRLEIEIKGHSYILLNKSGENMPLVEVPDLTRISDELKPKSREDGSYRLAYLSASISMFVADGLAETIRQCRSGDYGDNVARHFMQVLPHEKYTAAIKHLCCISLYLMSYEQGEDCPEWLSDFLASCVRSMDQIIAGPSVWDIMGMYAEASGSEIYDLTPCIIMADWGVHDVVPAAKPLKDFLYNSAAFRLQILEYALSESREKIAQSWQDMTASKLT